MGYDKAMRGIWESKPGLALAERAVRRLRSLRVKEISASIHQRYSDMVGVPHVQLLVSAGLDEETVTKNYEHRMDRNISDFGIWSMQELFITQEEATAIVEATFGVNVDGMKKPIAPTYNCKKSKILENCYEKFSDFFRRQRPEEMENARKLLTEECRARLASSETSEVCEKAMDDYTVGEIKKTLLRFKGARPEILKRALDEYVCHEIMDI